MKYLLHLTSRARISVHVDNVQGRVTLVVNTGDISSTLGREGGRERRERERERERERDVHVATTLCYPIT